MSKENVGVGFSDPEVPLIIHFLRSNGGDLVSNPNSFLVTI